MLRSTNMLDKNTRSLPSKSGLPPPVDRTTSPTTSVSGWPSRRPPSNSATPVTTRHEDGFPSSPMRIAKGSQPRELAPPFPPHSSVPFPTERNTTVMTIHSDSDPEYEDPPPDRRATKGLMRTTTVMTLHSESDPEYDDPPTATGRTLSPAFRRDVDSRRMRSTTALTLHSDSEPESDNNNSRRYPLPLRQSLATSLGGASIIFNNGFSDMFSDGLGGARYDFERRRDPGADRNTEGNRRRQRRFVGAKPGTSDEDLTISDDNSHIGPAEMFIQESDINHDDENDDDDNDDDDNDNNDSDEVGHEDGRGIKDAFGSYLLAPMGFDDEEGVGHTTGVEGYSEAAERFQIFAGVNEFDESDQIGFEDQPYQVIPKNKRRDHERVLENKRRQGRLLLVSLLDNFCVLYDQSPERNRKLFYVICKTLSNMGIIDEEYLEEMSTVRSSYQRAFRSLVLSALTSIKQEQMILESRRIMAPPSSASSNSSSHPRRGSSGVDIGSMDSNDGLSGLFPPTGGMMPSMFLHTPSTGDSAFAPSTAMMRTMSFGDMFDNDPTRYKHDFVEICKLGKGGFASVFKARNKLDGIEYAIKKVRLRGGAKVRYEKIFREIKFLARLDHKNVIRYYSSWLEHADYPVSRREVFANGGGSVEVDSNGDLEDEYEDEYGDEDEYTQSVSMRDDETAPERFGRRSSVDYFSPHKEQHGTDPEDFSMGIVFGEEEEDEEEPDDGIFFEDSQDGVDVGRETSTPTQDMERTHSASSTLASRSIPGAGRSGGAHRHKQRSTMSIEAQDPIPTWEESENSSSKTRSSISNSYSVLSSSIEEIQRSLPSSYSGLGSRYVPPHPKDRPEDEHELQPFSFPNMRDINRKDFVGGGLSGLHGLGKSRGDHEQRRPHNGTGPLFTRDLTLFIQMQLCQTTLQDYLVYRNERPTTTPRTPSAAELSRKLSSSSRLGLASLSTGNGVGGEQPQTTHSTPGSPMKQQQQTCHRDLVDPAANQHIFRAIVEGVAYIHDQDMIHRDLKPGNIFLGLPPGMEYQRTQQQQQQQQQQKDAGFSQNSFTSSTSTLSSNSTSSFPSNGVGGSGGRGVLALNGVNRDCFSGSSSSLISLDLMSKEQIQEELFMNIESMIPKIGDFGLVTDMEGGALSEANGNGSSGGRQNNTTGSRSSRTRTTAVGTVTYASPEQLARPNLGYDQKADIYSLGIIFFELYHPFSTLMERHAVLRTLRNGELPPDFVSRWPKEAAFVLWLMAEDPRLRPTAREILEFDLIRKLGPGDESSSISGGGTLAEGGASGSSGRGRDAASGGLGTETGYPQDSKLPLPLTTSGGAGAIATTGRLICENCQARCRCPETPVPEHMVVVTDSVVQPIDTVGPILPNKSHHRGHHHHRAHHRSSKSVSSKTSRAELEQRAKEEGEKVKRLEMSMAAMRAENRALLDRIQALEQEKAMAWRSA
ncbi:Eukaryotic translation initiation factor 2-alpha kinase [Dissophora globulifera]|nr:Eukaryotic translation initiation factor 2-alpha kinase [Dissophora globulifera]